MDLEWSLERADGIAFVGVELRNEAPIRRRARVRNRLDGPVLPPRRNGVPERGWEEDGLTAVVGAEERIAAGYACPAPTAEPPVELVAVERVEADVGPGTDRPGADPTAATAVRRLGPARPPRDAVPEPTLAAVEAVEGDEPTRSSEPTVATGRASRDGDANGGDRVGSEIGENRDGGDDGESRDGSDDGESRDGSDDGESRDGSDDENPDGGSSDRSTCAPRTGTGRPDAERPAAVEEWFREVDRRIGTAEALSSGSLSAATDAVAERGDLEAAVALPDRLDADAAALRRLAADAERLADRADAAEVPTEALRRLA